ncbi:GSCFA domain-containing protein [Limibacter armeniacum]|uniref:GSCFA domain-containing protein n=1 Tax=Limibacter armeniacum TaxID=466084 RepID=UPI002FE645E6
MNSKDKTFRTTFPIQYNGQKISLNSNLLSIGSCFSDNIGEKLTYYKFKAEINPFGVIFNPLSAFKLIRIAAGLEKLKTNLFTEVEGIHRHFDFHSDLSAANEETLHNKINNQVRKVGRAIGSTNFLILTFGTAFVFRLNKKNEIVANCHKIPQKEFTQELLTVEQIVSGFKEIYHLFPSYTQVILTVSPVRHTRNGIPENNLSKSILRLACHQLEQQFQNVSYFPSYELLLDDLRDYRFFASDMVHPSEMAIDYIWERFVESCFEEGAKLFMPKWDKIRKALSHRPFNPETLAHQKFLQNTLTKLKQVTEVNVEEEIADLEAYINSFQ